MGRTHGTMSSDRSAWFGSALAGLLALGILLPQSSQALTAQRIASGLTQPVYVTAPPNDTAHIYIVLQTGRIMQLDVNTGQLTTWFTLTGLAASGEQGLLGMA